jgi:hypothetical protein
MNASSTAVRAASIPSERSWGWTAYAASAWAIGYAVFVRGYQAAGGTIGIPGTFEDPDGFRRASLLASIFLFVVGLGALAFVRPWGLRIPRWLLIVPALAGSVFAMAHALTGYVTKTLHLLGVIDIEFKGWAEVDEHELILWDLLFYEPWFFGLGLLVTLAALYHHRRTGGSDKARRRLVLATIAGTLVLTAAACVSVST